MYDRYVVTIEFFYIGVGVIAHFSATFKEKDKRFMHDSD